MKKRIANPDLPAPPLGKYTAKSHCRRVAEWIASNNGPNSGLIVLQSQTTHMTEDNDQEMHFRQRRPFYYLTGCDLPDCYFAYDIEADKSTLWIPPVDPESVVWAGMPMLPGEAMEKYDVDVVLTTDELRSGRGLAESLRTPQTIILAIEDRVDLSVFQSEEVQACKPQIDFNFVQTAIDECRVVKDSHEIAMLRHANIISSYAHERVLASVKAAKNERELNALFVMHCHANGCKDQAYSCICASGTGASALHYVHNDQPLKGKLNLLFDAGAEWQCYCADITRTFPLNGRFSPESREIYSLVLKMQTECMSMIKAGVFWEDVHMRAHTVGAEGLQALGILSKERTVAQILESKVMCRFLPHGLGHYLGMDTHDTGGHADYEDENEYFRYLRVRGRLPAGAVITNEPGLYFREFPLREELQVGKWDGVIDQEVLKRYWTVGGIRIEDDILILEDGYENLTTVEKSLDYIENAVNAE